ncbi:histamine H2 receptor-like [Littorina saxatilis]|uniref:histamine H2 receptor-like n=1 Tax=Littorina saxatilis TaxID=31220 RepID=UPI0038B5285E
MVNCVTIFTFATVERLRTFGNMLVVSLAVTDLMVGLIMPLDAVNWMPEVSKQLQTSEMWCVLRLCWLNIGCVASFLNIVIIATDRYTYIVHPFLYERVVTSQKMLVTIVIGWVLAVLWGTVTIYDNKFSEVKLCDPIEAFSKGYAVYGATAILVTCFTITAVLYTLIFRLALSKLRTVVPGIPKNNTNNILHQQLQVAKQSLAVFLVFAISWTPHYAIYLVHVIAPQPYRARAFATTVGFCNSGLNFFIYVIFNRAFRTKIKCQCVIVLM